MSVLDEKNWFSVFGACELFRNTALSVSEHLGYNYNQHEDNNMMEYLINVKSKNVQALRGYIMQNDKVKLTNACPVFVTNDVKRTVDFYVEKLGFKFAAHYYKLFNDNT